MSGEQIDVLIGKVLTGEASPDEVIALEQWRSGDTANRKYFDQAKLLFEKAAASPIDVDTEAAWRKVLSRIERSNVPEASQVISLAWALRIAATVLVFAAVGYYVFLRPGPAVEPLTVSATTESVSDTLPDGTTVFLNRNTVLAYEYSPARKARVLKVTGEAFIEVKEARQPLFVEVDGLIIKDIGTAFNVKAYPDRPQIVISVEEGEVHVFTTDNEGIKLKAGESGQYDKIVNRFEKLQPDTNRLAYKTRLLVFRQTPLSEVAEKIQEVYGIRVELANEVLGQCRLTADFANEDSKTVIEVVTETMELTAEWKDAGVILYGKGCER